MSRRLLWMAPRPNAKEMSTNRATEIVITIIFDTTLLNSKSLQNICQYFVWSWRSFFSVSCIFQTKDLKQILKTVFNKWWNIWETCKFVMQYAPWCHYIYILHTYFKRLKKNPIGTVCCNTHWAQVGWGLIFSNYGFERDSILKCKTELIARGGLKFFSLVM